MIDHPGIQIVTPSFELLSDPEEVARIPQLLERCIRVCYKSEDKITEDSADTLIKRVAIKGKDEVSKHESVLEHGAITGRFTFSRTASHQLVRHRIAAYSQESQRFCNYGKKKHGKLLKVICPSTIDDLPAGTVYRLNQARDVMVFRNEAAPLNQGHKLISANMPPSPETERTNAFLYQCLTSYQTYLNLLANGVKAEDARFVLPNACKTEVCTTYNIRQWRHVFTLRCDGHAQWEIRSTMKQALAMFIKLIPCCFEDMDWML